MEEMPYVLRQHLFLGGGRSVGSGGKLLAELKDAVVELDHRVAGGVVEVDARLLKVQEKQFGHVLVHLVFRVPIAVDYGGF